MGVNSYICARDIHNFFSASLTKQSTLSSSLANNFIFKLYTQNYENKNPLIRHVCYGSL